jgi:hypothetical protein
VADRYVNQTPVSSPYYRDCERRTNEANQNLANGNTNDAAGIVEAANVAKGCTIVYRAVAASPR